MRGYDTESMTRGEWWDDAAPYGANGYSFGRGERVDMTGVRVAREVTFPMMPGDPNCVARGVAELTDGRVYQFTILKPGHSRECGGRRRVRFASLSRQSFGDLANGLIDWERNGGRMTDADAARYRQEVADKL